MKVYTGPCHLGLWKNWCIASNIQSYTNKNQESTILHRLIPSPPHHKSDLRCHVRRCFLLAHPSCVNADLPLPTGAIVLAFLEDVNKYG